jgi:hypothetical protein
MPRNHLNPKKDGRLNKPINIHITQGERGQALVELAISLVLLLILISGLVDVGRGVIQYMAIRDAVQDGIVYGSINPSHCVQIRERVQSNLEGLGLFTVDVMIDGVTCETLTPEEICAGREIIVTAAQDDFVVWMPFFGALFPDNHLPLSATERGEVLRPACPDTP